MTTTTVWNLPDGYTLTRTRAAYDTRARLEGKPIDTWRITTQDKCPRTITERQAWLLLEGIDWIEATTAGDGDRTVYVAGEPR